MHGIWKAAQIRRAEAELAATRTEGALMRQASAGLAAQIATLLREIGGVYGAHLTLVVGAVLLASAGLGFCVAAVSPTDAQAVQYTMLLLLATIFLSGLVLSLERFVPQIRWVALALPPTYGIELIRDVMLRGVAPGAFLLGALVLFGAVLTIVGWLGTKRRLQRT